MELCKKIIDSRYVKRILFIVITVGFVFGLIMPAFVHAGYSTFRVSTSEEFINAVKEINAGADDAEYVIEMLDDIEITSRAVGSDNASLQFKKGITTIYGNGHVLSSSYDTDSLIFAAGSSVVNLGSSDESEKSKLFFNESDSSSRHPDLLGITDSATVNVYEGIVFRNNNAVGRPGGAISVGEFTPTNATLNMYGGIITNCQDTYTNHGGAIFVGDGGTFNMYNGRIENNKAGSYGGGVLNLGTFTMNGGVIQNNEAKKAADDIFSQGTINLNVDAIKNNGFGTLTKTNKQIKGWFEDGNNESGNRWNLDNYCFEVTIEEASKSEVVALKAAHGSNVNVIFNLNSGVWNDTDESFIHNADNTYTEKLETGAIAVKPIDPTRTDYKFIGWFTKEGEEYKFNTEVNEDITLYAKWKYNNYKESVTIDKTYIVADGYTGAGNVITSDGLLKEEITLKVEEYKSFNREAGKTDIPAFANEEYKFTTGLGEDKVQIPLPDFEGYGIGDYWYKVTESSGNIAGITYDENEYYMHIVVTHEDASNLDDYGITQITLHKNAPDENGTYINEEGDKATGVTNAYAAGSLSITKDIKGNFADRTKKFDVVVTFKAPEGKTVTGDIYYGEDSVAVEGGNWNEKSVTITLGLGDTVEFKNIPDGVTYTIIENDYSSEGYEKPVYTFDNADENGDVVNTGNDWNANNVQGTITDDEDIVTITNEKNATIDVGVFLENAPFVALIVFAGVILAVMIIRRRQEIINKNSSI